MALADERHQALARDDPGAHPTSWKTISAIVETTSDPDQLVAVVGAEHRVGRDPRRVIVGEAGEESRADDGEERCCPADPESASPPRPDALVDVATDGMGTRHGRILAEADVASDPPPARVDTVLHEGGKGAVLR